MTTRTILLTLAASVAPLYAQQIAAPLPASQVFSALAAPALPATAATPEQRAELFNALALLPPEVSEVAVLTRLGDNLLALAQSGKLPELDAGDLPAELLALDNVALASTAATPATYALLRHALVSLSTLDSTMQLASSWAVDARPELVDALVEGLVLQADAAAILPDGAADGAHVPASYIIITTKPGEEALLQECNKQLLADLQDSGRPGITRVEDANGFSGIRMDVVETYRDELEEATKDMAPRRKAQLLDELAKHPLHLLSRQQGHALIIALCEDPQELKLAATPAESLLGTDKLAACDANLSKGMIAAALISPELSAVGNAVNSDPSFQLADGVRAAFSKLAEVDTANKAAFEQAADAIAFLSKEFKALQRPITHPTMMQAWCDGDLHLTLCGDAQGCRYDKGVLRLAAMADAPKTSLYTESTPMRLGATLPPAREILEAVLAVAQGFSLSLKEEDRAQAQAAFVTLNAFMPELQSLATAGKTIGKGLDGQLAFVLDSAYTSIPPVAGAQPGTQAEAPRFAIFAGVDDRSKLAAGWEELKTTAGQVAEKLGAPAEIIALLPITTKTVGAATSYSITLPFFTQDAVPSVAVTDTGLAIGSSTNLTAQVADSATGTTPFAGGAFALKFAPLARTLRSLATALDHDAEEAEPAALSKVRLEHEKAVISTPNGPVSVFTSVRTTNIEDAADGLSTAAAIFEYASTVAEGLYGTTTIDNGQHVLHVELRMKK